MLCRSGWLAWLSGPDIGGRGDSDGQDKVRYPSVNCALPHPVPGMRLV